MLSLLQRAASPRYRAALVAPGKDVAMRYIYDPFVMRRMAEGRIFCVTPQMPFEYFVYCFQAEKPFFFVTQLEDGRISIVPNVTFIPWNLFQTGYWPQDLLPEGCEYVTMRDGSYPVILSAHPVNNYEQWLGKFVRCVDAYAKQTLGDFINMPHELHALDQRTGEWAPKKKAEFATV